MCRQSSVCLLPCNPLIIESLYKAVVFLWIINFDNLNPQFFYALAIRNARISKRGPSLYIISDPFRWQFRNTSLKARRSSLNQLFIFNYIKESFRNFPIYNTNILYNLKQANRGLIINDWLTLLDFSASLLNRSNLKSKSIFQKFF